MLVGLGFAIVGTLIHFMLASPAIDCVALLALGLSGWKFFVAIDLTVDDGGVEQQWLGGRRRDGWNSFRAFSALTDGFILWPSENCCPLDAANGLFLPCTAQKADLMVLLRRHLVELP